MRGQVTQRRGEAEEDRDEDEDYQESHGQGTIGVTGTDYSAEGQRHGFRPSVGGTLATVAGLAVFVSLGLWQLERAAEKRELLAREAQRGEEAALRALPGTGPLSESELYARAELTGRYEADRQVLLDNMTLDGRVGYQVLTPLRLDSGERVLVNRGWVAGGTSRADLPEVDVPEGPHRVSGRLVHLPRPGLRLGDSDPGEPGDPWPRVLLYPTVEVLRTALGEPVPDYQLQLDPAAPHGYERRWEIMTMEPERHIGYAVQWFAFAAVLMAIWFILTLRRGRSRDE